MSETRDKRRRNDLDLFVLALIQSGVATPYELQRHAGLSQGATVPALERLLEAGMVRQGKPGSRGRVEYRITKAGANSLAGGWRALIEEGPSADLGADVRVALLAVWIGGDRKVAVEFLKESANRKLQSVQAKEENIKARRPASLADWYRELRSDSTTVTLKGESSAALAMARRLSKNHFAKAVPQRRDRLAAVPKGR
jgi:DNA-binding PadR family transcriptional regulator